MSNIKTITLTGSEESVAISGCNCAVRNDSTTAVYISALPDVTAGADGVLSVPADGSAVLYGHSGTVYLLGTGSVQLVGCDYSENPFKTVSSSGGSGADTVARAAIEAHAGNGEIHVTAEEKTAWSGKAELTDIPATLPADGGNADTLDGKHAAEFYQLSQTVAYGADYNTLINSGLYLVQGNAENPTANDPYSKPDDNAFYLYVARRNANYVSQIAVDVYKTALFARNLVAGTWGSWVQIVTGGNDG